MAAKETKAQAAAAQAQQNEKTQALDRALAALDKQFGRGTVMKLGSQPKLQVDVIPTGSLELDSALGVGGIPRGRIIEVYGPESSGKTTVALHVVAEVQKKGGIAAFIDAEHALDPAYAKRLGVNIDELYVSQPNTGEDALEIAEALIRSGAVDIVVVDSVAALVPRAEIDGEMGDTFVGLQARMMSQAMRKQIGNYRRSLDDTASRRVMRSPTGFIDQRRLELDGVRMRMTSASGAVISEKRNGHISLAAKLDALSPLKVLGRGYAIASAGDGSVVRDAGQVEVGDLLRLRLAKGGLACRVEHVVNADGRKV